MSVIMIILWVVYFAPAIIVFSLSAIATSCNSGMFNISDEDDIDSKGNALNTSLEYRLFAITIFITLISIIPLINLAVLFLIKLLITNDKIEIVKK